MEGFTKKLFRWLSGAAAVAFLLFAIFITINWRDEPLSEASQTFAKILQNRPLVTPEQNAYLMVLGFNALPDADPLQLGVTREAWTHSVRELDRDTEYLQFPGESFSLKANASQRTQALLEKCSAPSAGCQKFMLDLVEANELSVDEAWLLDRYQKLLGYRRWAETGYFDLNMPFPDFPTLLAAQKLFMVTQWKQAIDVKNLAQVERDLKNDMRFWREILSESDWLITKMIAVAALRRNIEWSNTIAHMFALDSLSIELWQEPLTAEELSFERVLAGEWRFTQGLLTAEANRPKIIAHFWVKPQASLNLYAQRLQSYLSLVTVDVDQLAAQIEQANLIEYPEFPAGLYNLGGQLEINREPPSNFNNYLMRLADLEGARRAFLALQQIRTQELPLDHIQEWLNISPWQSPYKDRPFRWCKLSRELIFKGYSGQKRDTYEFAL